MRTESNIVPKVTVKQYKLKIFETSLTNDVQHGQSG